jgi:hypothetical protein
VENDSDGRDSPVSESDGAPRDPSPAPPSGGDESAAVTVTTRDLLSGSLDGSALREAGPPTLLEPPGREPGTLEGGEGGGRARVKGGMPEDGVGRGAGGGGETAAEAQALLLSRVVSLGRSAHVRSLVEGKPTSALRLRPAVLIPCRFHAPLQVVFSGGPLATTYSCRGWWRPQDHWAQRKDIARPKPRPPNLNRNVTDPKYRTRLCSHWDASAGLLGGQGGACPMRKRNKCDFAHGPGGWGGVGRGLESPCLQVLP